MWVVRNCFNSLTTLMLAKPKKEKNLMQKMLNSRLVPFLEKKNTQL